MTSQMLLFEEHARLLLVVHAVLALATVALSTHLVFWLRPIVGGRFGRNRAVRRFALLSAGAYVATMAVGLALYPTYKVRVRSEFLENPSAITRDTELRARARVLAQERNEESRRYRMGEAAAVTTPADSEGPGTVVARADARVEHGARLARWFDVKEHWTALGVMMAAALVLIVLSWKPERDTQGISKVVLTLAIGVAGTAWSAAIIGILTAATRSVSEL